MTRQIPLWAILIIPFITIISGVVAVTGYWSLQNSQAAVNDIAAQLMGETNARIDSHLGSFLTIPTLINQTHVNALQDRRVDLSDQDALGHYFWEEIQIYDSVSSIYFGNTDGGLITAGREGADGSLYLIESQDFSAGPLGKYAIDAAGNPIDTIATVPNFDARTRPWYQGAVERQGPNWTAPYVLSTGQDLAIAASQPVYDVSGEFLGVVSVDIFISQIGSFLQSLNIGQSGQAYIVEHSGLLVASSAAVSPFVRAEDSTWQRLSAKESADPIIAASADYIVKQFGQYTDIEEHHRLTTDLNGKRYYVWVTPFHDLHGLDWFIVIAIPEDDFLGQIKDQNRITLLLTLIAIGAAVLIGLLTAVQVSRPISRLSTAATALAGGDWSQTVPIKGVLEIQQLGQSFNTMAAQLYEMFNHLEERVQARTADLEASEARYRAIVEDQTELICRYLPDHTLTFVNDAYCRFFDEKREEVIGHSFMPHIHDDDQAKLGEQLADLNPANPVRIVEHRVILPGGETRWMQWVNRMLLDEQGNTIEIQAVGRDITERKRFEETLQKALDRETELGELKTHFISTVSHEFRTPLTVIMNSSEILHRYADQLDPEKKEAHFQRIRGQIRRITSLLEDVLIINRAERKKWSFNPELLDLAALCQSVISEVRATAEIDLTFEFTFTGVCTQVADKKLITLILSNLISNAAKYSLPGSTITITLACSAEQIVFSVQDSGIGIPQEAQPHIFDPFYRAGNIDTIAGTGLGLTIVRQSVEQHGGTITFESTVEKGTIFTVTLPVITALELPYEENPDH